MRIRLVQIPRWSYRGEPWPPLGEVMDLPEGIARDMIQGGFAQAALETAAVEPPANAARRVGRPKAKR